MRPFTNVVLSSSFPIPTPSVAEVLFAPFRLQWPLRWLVEALIVFGLLVTWVAPSANADGIYWTSWSSVNPGSIGRANLDGSGVNQSFITGADAPDGIAIDDTHIYWSNTASLYGPRTVGRANLDGTDVNQDFIIRAEDFAAQPAGVAVDAGYIYWANHSLFTIGRANLDGSGVNQGLIDTNGHPEDLAIDGTHVYWVNLGIRSIARADINGTGLPHNIISLPFGSQPFGVAVDETYIYWTEHGLQGANSAIGRANLDGSGMNRSFITGLTYPGRIAVDGTFIYWTSWASQSSTSSATIGRANLDGTDVDQTFITGLSAPRDIAISLVPIPEPSTGVLMMGGVLGLAISRRRAGASA